MKYYSEEASKAFRVKFEEEVLGWPQVSAKKMFGCPCYQANGKLFAFLVTNGVVITRLDQKDRETLSRQHQTTPFRGGRRVVQNWHRLSIENKNGLNAVMSFVRKSYQSALRRT